MALRTFTPIPGLLVPPNGGTPSLFYTAPAGGAIVTRLRIANPITGGASVLHIWRQPNGASPAVPDPLTAQSLIYAGSVAVPSTTELRNIFMNVGDTLYALVDVSGPIISGDAASGI
jgi:hypothetical protein